MRLPQTKNGIDVEQTKEMVDLFLQAEFTYFDTAWAYAGSEDAIRQALVERYPRELPAGYQKCGMDQLQDERRGICTVRYFLKADRSRLF